MTDNSSSCLQLLICPVCDENLLRNGRSLRCPQNHTFDLAREGYVNLWLRKKQPKFPGDSKEMLQARRRFLDAGYYDPLAIALNDIVTTNLNDYAQNKCVLLDVGCGEGYYLGQMATAVAKQDLSYCYFGLDNSKEAARLAAKRYKTIQFLVADVKQQIPLTTGTVDILLNIFAPRNATEFHRVTHPGSQLLVVIPTPDHLDELRRHYEMLQIEVNKQQQVIDQMAPYFELRGIQTIVFPIQPTAEDLQDLLQMMPTAGKNRQRPYPSSQANLTATAHIEILQFIRK